jgi:L-alanine-DL-glutamate epimerase-like enolase superfamily enzyme
MGATCPAITDGTMEVSQAPGFGLALDEGMIRRYRVD